MLSALRHHRRLVLAFFLLAAAFLYLAHIGSYHLIELDEGRYHRIPMEMVLSGDYLTPHFDYMPYFEKPILQYWVTALAMKIFGFKEFTGRVLPALTGFGNVLLAYVLGRSMYNGRTGLMAAIILATSALQLIVASIGVLDMALTFFVDACLVTFYLFERTEEKKYLLLFYTAMGLGMLTKGLIAIAFPVGILFWYAMLTRRPKLFLKLFYVPGILLFLAISVPWYYLVSQANPDFFYFFFIREHFLRFATKMHERFHPWYYFVPVLIAGLMPWTGFLATFFSKKGIFRAPGTLRHKQDTLLVGRPDLRLLQHLRFKTTDVYPALLAALIGPDRRLFGTVPPRKILAGPQFSHQLPALPPVYGSRRRLPHEHRFSDDCRLFQPRRPAHRLPPHRNGGCCLVLA